MSTGHWYQHEAFSCKFTSCREPTLKPPSGSFVSTTLWSFTCITEQRQHSAERVPVAHIHLPAGTGPVQGWQAGAGSSTQADALAAAG